MIKYGFWAPVFGGWLRNVKDEQMPATFDYVKKVAQTAEQNGFSTTLIPELNLNDIKGIASPSLEAWSTAAALAAVTSKLEIMVAVRPVFHNPALTAKTAATIDRLSHGRFLLNVVSAWWKEEARQYGAEFTAHDERYDRTKEFVTIIKGLWRDTPFSFSGKYYHLKDTYLSPKPVQQPGIPLYAGGESEKGRQTIAESCDAYVMHGGSVDEIAGKISEMKERRRKLNQKPFSSFGMAAFVICRDTEAEAEAELARITDVREAAGYAGFKDFVTESQLERKIQLQDYSVSNRGLRPNFIGTAEQIADRILAYERIGIELLLLQFSPQLEEMQRFSEQVIPLVEKKRAENRVSPQA